MQTYTSHPGLSNRQRTQADDFSTTACAPDDIVPDGTDMAIGEDIKKMGRDKRRILSALLFFLLALIITMLSM